MANPTESNAIAELRAELKAEFSAIHKRLESLDKTTQRTERKTDRGFKSVADTLAWQDLIQNLILYGVCLTAVGAVTSIGMIRSEVCPKAPGWALHLIPFGEVVCSGATDKPAASTGDPIVALRQAIIGQESGGRSDAVNHSGSGATGLGQVMPENIAAWSQQCIGRSLTQDEFKNSPDLQLQIIDCKLKEYWNQVDGDTETKVRKVASMWYSGQSKLYDSPAPQSWNGNTYPSIRDYTLSVLEKWKKEMRSVSVSAAAGGKTVPLKGVIVTSAVDASGEPGLDYVVSDGDRGAEFGALVPGTVIKTVFEDWESHLESGDTRRGYGSYVIVRVQDGIGQEIDVLYAHMDSIAVKEGDSVSVGTVIGTQGRKGSTTAPHVSVDFFAPGTRTANAASLAMRDRIAGILANNPDSLNQKIQAASSVSSGAENNAKPAAAPQATARAGVPSSFVSVQTPKGLCSGFAVAADKVVTAKHCISDLQNTIVIPQSGDWLKGQVVATAEDAAIVQVDGANFTPAQLGTVPAAGDTVTSWGHPHGAAAIESAQIKITTNEGSVFAAAPVGDRRVVDGFSGGQVVDSAGRVIGFNSEANPAGMVKVQSIEVVKELLK